LNDAKITRKSIRRRLLAFLIPSLLTLVIGAGMVTYWVALQTANAAYDRALLDPVIDLSENIKSDASGARLDLSVQAQQALLYDQSDRLVFQIRAPDGKVIAGVEDLAGPAPSTSQKLFFDAVHRGDPIRVAATRTENGFLVQVGETLNKRDVLVREILAAELVPTLLIAMISIGLAWMGVARGLAPLERVRGELLQRSAQDLSPVDDRAVPEELAPAVAAFNRLLDRLHEASEMQQRFLANAAHQLRTPLAGLQMHLELLLRRELAPDVRAEVETMHNATTRASRLARQLLALAKAESASSPLQPLQVLDLRTVIDAAADEWVPRALERDIDLGFAVDSANVLGDPISLRELLNNLVDNALRYTPSGGTVTVRSGEAAGGAFLAVEDTGHGIPEAARNRIFERFYRVDGSAGEGSGLGLAIVKEVVERHGAKLAVETPERGKGTRIVVFFPACRPANVERS
jgi:two-component system, OmpR family, sensor histidine kinase TctE